MCSTNQEGDLSSLSFEKIAYGEELLSLTSQYKNLEGIQKLQRKIRQELNFLKKITKTGAVKKEHLQCSNLTHFSALLDTLKTLSECVNVSKVMVLDDRKIVIDIVCDGGLTWIKVVARNPRSLSQICMGDTSYGVRSVVDQAEEFVECARLHPCFFQTPKVVFVFANGIGANLAAILESVGVVVEGTRLDDVDIEGNELEEGSAEILKPANRDVQGSNPANSAASMSRANLDVSAMLGYVSSVTNGSAALYDFPVKVLAQQAEWEKERPQKPILDEFFKGKKLYCCQTAYDSFLDILRTVGGPNEKIRAEEFLKRVTVLPDGATLRDIDEACRDGEVFSHVQLTPDKSLTVGGKIRERSQVIFAFGDRIKAVTVTANDGFVRAAQQQGINFVVFIHESRALTEQKEQTKATVKTSNT